MGRSANVHLLMALQGETSSGDGAIRDNFAIKLSIEFISRKFQDGIWVSKDESILERKGSRLYFYRWQRWNNRSPWVVLPGDD